MHPVYVFVRRNKDGLTVPVKKMNNTGWRSARERAADAWGRVHGTVAPQGFRRVRVQDLKHTFGRRLRAAGVSFENRQDFLGLSQVHHQAKQSWRSSQLHEIWMKVSLCQPIECQHTIELTPPNRCRRCQH
jgi:hypothetical protein